jgi:predicted small lipoprotein YifL
MMRLNIIAGDHRPQSWEAWTFGNGFAGFSKEAYWRMPNVYLRGVHSRMLGGGRVGLYGSTKRPVHSITGVDHPAARKEVWGGPMKRVINRSTLWIAYLAIAGAGCRGPAFNLPPADQIAAPGPGVGGPGPGVLTPHELSPEVLPQGMPPGPWQSGSPTNYSLCGCLACKAKAEAPPDDLGIPLDCAVGPSVQVHFTKPEGMQVNWDVTGSGQFDSMPLIVPGRTNFQQAGLYRLKLTNIPEHEGVELYPTIEVAPTNPRTHAFLAHNTVPIQLTVDDLNQVSAGNFVTKVIYLPDPDFQQLAVAGVETLVSTRLDPGEDPIVEADRRGSILCILRIGNKDIEMPGLEEETMLGYSSIIGCSDPMAAAGQVSGGVGAFGGAVGAMGYVTGVTSPAYGMPTTGTPIGLPGPPHIPLGGPAGLRKHVMRNHTHNYIPDPSHKVKIHVKESPGISYPPPRTRAWIHQYNHPNCAHCLKSASGDCGCH